LADIDLSTGLPQFINAQRIPLEEGACVCQLLFSQNGQLFFSVDYSAPSIDSKNLSLPASIEETHKNFWNVVCLDVNDLVLQKVTSSFSEFGYPHWVYGDSRIVQFDPTTLLCFSSTSKGDELYFIDQTTLKVSNALSSPLNNQYFGNLSSDKCGRAIALMFSADDTPAVIEFSVDEKLVKYCDPIVLQRTVQVMPKTDISVAEHFSFPTRDGAESNGYYYSPCNSRYDHSGVPPLIVMVHGGPTARAYGYFDLQKQYWTSRGFAVFDVNHRGSNGYGRKYRDALKGQWGVLDTSDIVDGIDYLVSRDKADASKVCIRGKSAGGYAVLRALTEYPERFHAGACYYGIGNLATLAQITHKFEKFYTDHLIGEAYDPVFAREPKSLFYQRSPIYKLNQLQTPMIIFQGLEDKVVPPALAQEVIAALQAQSLSYSYVEYPNEGHGFRHAETNIDAWTKELAFYKSTLLTNN